MADGKVPSADGNCGRQIVNGKMPEQEQAAQATNTNYQQKGIDHGQV
jgi:hypothetical protein